MASETYISLNLYLPFTAVSISDRAYLSHIKKEKKIYLFTLLIYNIERYVVLLNVIKIKCPSALTLHFVKNKRKREREGGAENEKNGHDSNS